MMGIILNSMRSTLSKEMAEELSFVYDNYKYYGATCRLFTMNIKIQTLVTVKWS